MNDDRPEDDARYENGRSYVLGVSRTTFAIVTNEKYRAGGGGRHRFITLAKRDLVVLISRRCHPPAAPPPFPIRPTNYGKASIGTNTLSRYSPLLLCKRKRKWLRLLMGSQLAAKTR